MPSTPAAVVLLVQADHDSREMYAEFFRYQGLLPIPVSNARDGLTVARKADIIVTGLLLLGDIDGIEFIARLKRDERTKRIPLIVLTACAWKSDRHRAEEAGCDIFLAKPCPITCCAKCGSCSQHRTFGTIVGCPLRWTARVMYRAVVIVLRIRKRVESNYIGASTFTEVHVVTGHRTASRA